MRPRRTGRVRGRNRRLPRAGLPHLFAVILAGGRGERFWPLSTAARPKQFLPFRSGRSLLEATFSRLAAHLPPDRILVVTAETHAVEVRRLLPDLQPSNLLLEPTGRDTAPALALAAAVVRRRDPEACLLACPTDHVIGRPQEFWRAVRRGFDYVAARGGLLTFGVRPTRVETGFGYIRPGRSLDRAGLFRVARFIEKPDKSRATRLVREGSALWNSGIFLWRCSTFLDACDRYVPGLRQNVEAIAAASTVGERRRRTKRLFPRLPRISVDYGILEQCRDVAVLPVTFPWDDVGSWGALARLRSLDGYGNAVIGPHVGIDTRGCVIQAASRVVGTIGLRDLIIVDGPGGLLVAAKERAQEVRALAQRASREERSRATRRSWE